MSARHVIGLVARRELRERGRNSVFILSTVLLLAVVAGSTLLLRELKPEPTTYHLAVTTPVPRGLAPALKRAARPFDDATVELRPVATAAAGREELRAKRVDALLLLAKDRLVFRAKVDAKVAAVADTAVRALRQHAPPTPELSTATLEPASAEPNDAEVLAAMLGASLLLGAIAVYGQWVLTGVLEEKSNRVVELILSTVPARWLLAGKVIGIGLLGLVQLMLVGGLAAVLLAAGAFDAPTSLGGRRARLPVRGRELRRRAGHLHAPRGLLRRLRDPRGERERPAREHPHRLPPDRPDGSSRPKRARSRSPLGAHPCSTTCPGDDLRARAVRRARLCPWAPPHRCAARPPRRVAARARGVTRS